MTFNTDGLCIKVAAAAGSMYMCVEFKICSCYQVQYTFSLESHITVQVVHEFTTYLWENVLVYFDNVSILSFSHIKHFQDGYPPGKVNKII